MRRDRSSPHPGELDRELVERLRGVLEPIVRRMWPWAMHGLEHLPDHDRFIVIANHSGMGAAELWALTLAWYERGARPIAGMAHPAAFRVPILRQVLQGLGAVEATREGAARARRAGVPLLLFPGGDHEASRPIWQARRVDFAGRKGWIRLAREHELDIVPLCITGSHVTLPILGRGRALSWALGLRLLGAHRAPLPALGLVTAALSLSLARAAGLKRRWAALAAVASIWPTLMLPWIPSRIGFHVLPPIAAGELADPAGDGILYDRVVTSLERTLRAAR
jgi:1-acyl-sn-glycerol-3-phosphate acyltransferase